MTNPAFPDARNTAARAISSGWAMRASGIEHHLGDFRLAAAIARLGGVGKPRCDRIDPNSVGGEFQRHRPGQR